MYIPFSTLNQQFWNKSDEKILWNSHIFCNYYQATNWLTYIFHFQSTILEQVGQCRNYYTILYKRLIHSGIFRTIKIIAIIQTFIFDIVLYGLCYHRSLLINSYYSRRRYLVPLIFCKRETFQFDVTTIVDHRSLERIPWHVAVAFVSIELFYFGHMPTVTNNSRNRSD